jgi:hypothetical protein
MRSYKTAQIPFNFNNPDTKITIIIKVLAFRPVAHCATRRNHFATACTRMLLSLRKQKTNKVCNDKSK